MRCVQREVHEKGLGLVGRNKLRRLGSHQLGEKFSVLKNLFSVAPKVMSVRAVPVKEVRVVVDAAAHVAEGMVEALGIGHGLTRVAEVPFANVGGGVAGFFERLGEGHLRGGHAGTALAAGDIARHSGADRITPGKQARE